MTREERIELIKHLKYNRSIGADYSITDKDVDEIIKALEQEPCEDCVSRAELKKWLDINFSFGGALRKLELFDRLDRDLPPVTSQPKVGHWILKRTFPTKLYDEHIREYECSECHRAIRCTESQLINYPYCHCGAKMQEVEE